MGSLEGVFSPENMTMNPLNAEEFRRQGHMMVDFLAEYYRNIEEHPVRSSVEPGYLSKCLPKSAPLNPEPIEAILRDVDNHVVPGLTHWQSPNFFAYYQSNASIAGILGDMLCSGFGVVGFSWISSPAATELESLVMNWLGEMLKLPKTFLLSGSGGGVIHGNTTEAIICTLVVARDKALRENAQADGSISKLVVYASDQTHCSLRKAAQIVGISPQNVRAIKTTEATRFGLCPKELRKAIASDIKAGLVPLYLCATVGTTSTASIDPLIQLCETAKEYGMWVHVDAAYAGGACICPEFRQFIDGVELADSFSFNAHKWFLTGLDCCCLWVKDPASLSAALSTDPEYLRNKASESNQVIDYKDWQISLSRRFRALKLWLVLRSHGVVNLRMHIRNHVRLARLFEELVRKDDRFEVVGQVNFALVCFRVSPAAVRKNMKIRSQVLGPDCVNEVNAKVLERVNATGRVFMTHTVVGDTYVIRFAVGSTLVEDRHILMAWCLLQEQADAVLSCLNGSN